MRGTPALLFYRGSLDRRDRTALAFYSATELPLLAASLRGDRLRAAGA